MHASISPTRMVSAIASTVTSVQGRKSNTRSSVLPGGGLSWMRTQQWSKIAVRSLRPIVRQGHFDQGLLKWSTTFSL